MSAAARARATVSSSSGGTGGRRVVVGVYRVRLHGGFLSQGLAPWVILADGPGGLIVPGFARAQVVVTLAPWYANLPGRIGQEGGGGRARASRQYRG